MKHLHVLLLISALIIGPGDGGAEPAAADIWRTWRILSIDGEPAAPKAELAFDAMGRMAGSVGCNRFMARISVREGRLMLSGPLAMTRMACHGRLDRHERFVLRVFEASPWIGDTPHKDRLLLYDSGNNGSGSAPAIWLERKEE